MWIRADSCMWVTTEKRAWGPLELELVSCLIQVKETKAGFSGRAASTGNCSARSPTPVIKSLVQRIPDTEGNRRNAIS